MFFLLQTLPYRDPVVQIIILLELIIKVQT